MPFVISDKWPSISLVSTKNGLKLFLYRAHQSYNVTHLDTMYFHPTIKPIDITLVVFVRDTAKQSSFLSPLCFDVMTDK